MADNINQFCFFCEKETSFKYTVKTKYDKDKTTIKSREEGYNCIICGGGATCDAKLRATIEQKQNDQPAHIAPTVNNTGPGGDGTDGPVGL